MRTIKVECNCCGKLYDAIVTSTCSKSCGATIRETNANAHGRKVGKNNGWMNEFELNKT